MKKTFTGWIGKEAIKYNMNGIIKEMAEEVGLVPKGRKVDWGVNEWPPIKVKVTVETVEK